MKKIIYLLCLMTLINCNKSKEMKEKLFPERPYETSKIDNFYWVDSDTEYKYIPLINPYYLKMSSKNNENWTLDTNSKGIRMEFDNNLISVISSIEPISNFNISNDYIYGKRNEYEGSSIPQYWYLYNTLEKSLKIFVKESDFKAELKKLNLAEEFLNPDVVFEQYKNDPVLPWFPEDIKKQLEEVKKQKGN